MHILLTDVLTCPRCGPGFGLILLSDRLLERRIIDGNLGCANCRESYPVRGGTADFRAPAERGQPAQERQPNEASGEAPPVAPGGASARLAALLGVTEGGGILLLAGAAAPLAQGVSEQLEHVEVVAAVEAGDAAVPAGGPVTRLLISDRLPFADRTLRGVALGGDAAGALLEEAARVLAPMHRLVLEGAGAGARERVEALGLEVLAEEGATLVALKRQAPDPPKLYQLI